MNKEYILDLSAGIISGRVQQTIYAIDEANAIERTERVLEDSVFASVANRATLWNGDHAVASWLLDRVTSFKKAPT